MVSQKRVTVAPEGSVKADSYRNCASDRGTLIVWSSLYMLQIDTGSCVRERIVSAAIVDSFEN
jgi:hypothetical protein